MTTEPAPVLDDLAIMQDIDKRNMLRLINELPEQFETAMGIARSFALEPMVEEPNVVFFTGVGDSAITADMAAAALAGITRVPVISDHGAHLPKYVDENSVVVVIGYDGKSDSLVRNYKDARQRGAQVICVTSGGKLLDAATKDGARIMKIPPGQPARTAAGYLLVPLLSIVEKLGLAENITEQLSHAVKLLKNAREALRFEYPTARNLAKQTAEQLAGKIAVIYGASDYRWALSRRWSGQISANTKMLAFDDKFPCTATSRISGWERADEFADKLAIVILRDASDKGEIAEMANRAQEMLGKFTFVSVEIKGASTLEKMLYGLYLGDYVSYYMALLLGVNPTPTEFAAQIESPQPQEEQPG